VVIPAAVSAMPTRQSGVSAQHCMMMQVMLAKAQKRQLSRSQKPCASKLRQVGDKFDLPLTNAGTFMYFGGAHEFHSS